MGLSRKNRCIHCKGKELILENTYHPLVEKILWLHTDLSKNLSDEKNRDLLLQIWLDTDAADRKELFDTIRKKSGLACCPPEAHFTFFHPYQQAFSLKGASKEIRKKRVDNKALKYYSNTHSDAVLKEKAKMGDFPYLNMAELMEGRRLFDLIIARVSAPVQRLTWCDYQLLRSYHNRGWKPENFFPDCALVYISPNQLGEDEGPYFGAIVNPHTIWSDPEEGRKGTHHFKITGMAISANEAHDLFTMQLGLLSFLCSVVRIMLPLNEIDLPDPPPDYDSCVLPISLPKTLSSTFQKQPNSLWKQYRLACMEPFDIEYLDSLITARFHGSDDHLFMLRTDAAYFAEHFGHRMSHLPESIRPDELALTTKNLIRLVAIDTLRYTYRDVSGWAEIKGLIRELACHTPTHSCEKAGPYEETLYGLKSRTLEALYRARYQLSEAFLGSPAFRHHYSSNDGKLKESEMLKMMHEDRLGFLILQLGAEWPCEECNEPPKWGEGAFLAELLTMLEEPEHRGRLSTLLIQLVSDLALTYRIWTIINSHLPGLHKCSISPMSRCIEIRRGRNYERNMTIEEYFQSACFCSLHEDIYPLSRLTDEPGCLDKFWDRVHSMFEEDFGMTLDEIFGDVEMRKIPLRRTYTSARARKHADHMRPQPPPPPPKRERALRKGKLARNRPRGPLPRPASKSTAPILGEDGLDFDLNTSATPANDDDSTVDPAITSQPKPSSKPKESRQAVFAETWRFGYPRFGVPATAGERAPPPKEKVKTRKGPSENKCEEPIKEHDPPYSETSDPAPLAFTVKSRTYDVFSAMFQRSSTGRATVPWSDFLYAMVEVGFSVWAVGGSAWHFRPKSKGVDSIQFHEPHPDSNIHPLNVFRFGRRLTRAYGWGVESFVLSQ